MAIKDTERTKSVLLWHSANQSKHPLMFSHLGARSLLKGVPPIVLLSHLKLAFIF